jgi:Tfp pilus assembly protein PilF
MTVPRHRVSPVPALAALALAVAIGAASAEIVVDSAGQKIDSALNEQVSRARELRMEQIPGFDIDESIAILEGITRDNPTYFRAWYNLALSYLTKDGDDIDRALGAFQKAAEIEAADPDVRDGSLYNSYGWALLNARRYEEAEKALLAGMALSDSNSSWTNSALNYNLGRLYFEQGNFALAEKYLDVAVTTYGNPAAVDLRSVLDKATR